ncbi:hypothetical protein H5410_057045 [Solanum commersonii]|uniref:Uncharacterized protein n=1 Tax=Solanum commersonii TaxID=4109 RepID=A0A9J5WP02_SOLCO|nr:hypothetical protein H5410_057045 [Solanum commersonii]
MAIGGVIASDEGMTGAGDEGARDESSGPTNVSVLRVVLSLLSLRGRACRMSQHYWSQLFLNQYAIIELKHRLRKELRNLPRFDLLSVADSTSIELMQGAFQKFSAASSLGKYRQEFHLYICALRAMLATSKKLLQDRSVVTKQLWALATKEDNLWIKCVNIYYMKGETVETCNTPRIATWVIRKIIDSRKIVMQAQDFRVISLQD